MTWVAKDNTLGEVALNITDVAGPGPVNLAVSPATGSGRMNFFLQEVCGYDPVYGAGVFIYVKGSGTINAGDVVELSPSLTSGVLTTQAVEWVGTANSGKPLGVALSTLTGSLYGWVQVQGTALVNISGTVAAGDRVFWQAAGIVSSTAVAGKQMLNAVAATANNAVVGVNGGTAIGAALALYYIDRPFAQGAIT